jgi:lipopolysaccharide biosynthesis regulator YciM
MVSFLYGLLLLLVGGAIGGLVCYWLARQGWFLTSASDRDPYLHALIAVLDEKHEKATDVLVKTARVNTGDVGLYRALAALFRRRGEFAKAIRLDRIVAVREDLRKGQRAEVLYHLALDYKGAGRVRQAVENLEEAARLDPKDGRIGTLLVDLYQQAGDEIQAYEVLARLAPSSKDPRVPERLAELQVEIGRRRLAAGDPKGARKHFRKALEHHPKGYAGRLHLGDAYLRSGSHDKAIAAWVEILEDRPELFGALYPRFEDAFFSKGVFDDLGGFIRDYLAAYRDSPRAMLILARYLAKKRRTDDAIRELRGALTVDPGFVEAHRELGLLLLDRGTPDEIAEAYREFLDHLPSLVPAYKCKACNGDVESFFWRCPACGAFETALPTRATERPIPGAAEALIERPVGFPTSPGRTLEVVDSSPRIEPSRSIKSAREKKANPA